MLESLKHPWPWYAGGIVIGLLVPTLLVLGNKHFGISSNFRHICAACFPGNIRFFRYDWKREMWNLFFAAGIVVGGILAASVLADPDPVQVAPELRAELSGYGLTDYGSLLPGEVFSWESLLTLRGFILMVVGGFLVGFGTRYAGGCTSGHAIMGLSNLQWPSLVATVCFMIGGFFVANLVLPYVMRL